MQIAKTGNEKYHFSKFERILVDVGTLLRMSTRGTTERAMQICIQTGVFIYIGSHAQSEKSIVRSNLNGNGDIM